MASSVMQCLLLKLHLQEVVELEKLQKCQLIKGKAWSFNIDIITNLYSS